MFHVFEVRFFDKKGDTVSLSLKLSDKLKALELLGK
jgi:hypothetical protein